jgi:predicted DNA-binding ribbon-helix-helix protein
MAQNQNQLTSQQNYIAQLLEQLTVNYQNTKLERKQIAQNFTQSEAEFTPLEEIELLTVSIRGYASQIAASGSLRNDLQAISELQKLSVFNNHLIVQLYGEARSHYPQMQSYICMLDYLRLLVLEYLQNQQTLQLISA